MYTPVKLMKYFLFQTQAHVLSPPENCVWLFVTIFVIAAFIFLSCFATMPSHRLMLVVKGKPLLDHQIQLSF